MILTTDEYIKRFDEGEPFNLAMAQTVASWWYSPGSPALVELTTCGTVSDAAALISEVDKEQMELLTQPATPEREDCIRDLNELREWTRRGDFE